jgi:hypothetical protein
VSPTWFDLGDQLPAGDDDSLLEFPWLSENGLPGGEPTTVDEVDPVKSDPTPPEQHPSMPSEHAPGCPRFYTQLNIDITPCGGLSGVMRERANDYQGCSIEDPKNWHETFANPASWLERHMRDPSAMNVFRLLAHYDKPTISAPVDRDKMFAEEVLWPASPGRSPLHEWKEGADFGANGLLRLLFLFADREHPPGRPLIPCHLQNEAKEQLLSFKYFGDEPARRPNPEKEAVYWSENHQLLYATAEYLAGQLMPDEWFQPTVHWRADDNAPWQRHTDRSWGFTGDERMARAYPRLIRWLDHRLMFGFSEWNSPVYYDYDIAGLLNLIDFCDDGAVRDKAAIALDLVLLDLARFHGYGRAGATAGRVYPTHKYSGWATTIANTAQILFGEWPVDETAEDVLEQWRIEAFRVRRQEHLDAFRTSLLKGDGTYPPNIEQLVADEAARWDNENHAAFQQRQRPPIRSPWTVADAPGAHSLATTFRYCVPDLIPRFAREPESAWFERSRVSVGFAEAAADYDIGFSDEEDVLAWWSRGAFAAPLAVVGSRNLADAWDVEDVSPFSDIPLFFTLPDPQLVQAADTLSVESEGSCLTTANLCLWREQGVSLSSVQKFRFGQVGRQVQVWQATLDPYVSVWSTYPAAKPSEPGADSDGPTWWGGNASQPRVVQRDDALICIHDSVLLGYINLKYGHRSHAWFPVQMFHEAYEVRPDADDEDEPPTRIDLHTGQEVRDPDLWINAKRGGVWWFGRRNNAYIALFSAKPNSALEPSGRWSQREIRCDDRVNVLVCQVGTDARFTNFRNFMRECCNARIHVALGVYQPSNPFVDISCSYDMPRGKRLSLNLEKRWPSYHGQDFSDEDFPRWQNSWNNILWRERDYTLTAPPLYGYGPPPTLHHNCHTGARYGTGL